jgi:hypothetical protein
VCQRPPHTHPRDKGGGQSGREHRARHSTTERAALGRQRGPRRQSWRLQEVDSPIHQSRQACGALVQFLTPPCYSKSCKQFKNARVQLNQPAGRLRLLMRPDERGAGLRTCMRPVCLSVRAVLRASACTELETAMQAVESLLFSQILNLFQRRATPCSRPPYPRPCPAPLHHATRQNLLIFAYPGNSAARLSAAASVPRPPNVNRVVSIPSKTTGRRGRKRNRVSRTVLHRTGRRTDRGFRGESTGQGAEIFHERRGASERAIARGWLGWGEPLCASELKPARRTALCRCSSGCDHVWVRSSYRRCWAPSSIATLTLRHCVLLLLATVLRCVGAAWLLPGSEKGIPSCCAPRKKRCPSRPTGAKLSAPLEHF